MIHSYPTTACIVPLESSTRQDHFISSGSPPPGSSSSPIIHHNSSVITTSSIIKLPPRGRTTADKKLTAIQILPETRRHLALVLDLDGQRRELGAVPEVAAAVHGLLEGVVLPAEDVVAVLAVAEAVFVCHCQSNNVPLKEGSFLSSM